MFIYTRQHINAECRGVCERNMRGNDEELLFEPSSEYISY